MRTGPVSSHARTVTYAALQSSAHDCELTVPFRAHFQRKVATLSRLSRRTQNPLAAAASQSKARFGGQRVKARGWKHLRAFQVSPALHRQLEIRHGRGGGNRPVGTTRSLAASRGSLIAPVFVIPLFVRPGGPASMLERALCGIPVTVSQGPGMSRPDHHIVATTGGGVGRREEHRGQQHCRCQTPTAGNFLHRLRYHISTDQASDTGRVKRRRL